MFFITDHRNIKFTIIINTTLQTQRIFIQFLWSVCLELFYVLYDIMVEFVCIPEKKTLSIESFIKMLDVFDIFECQYEWHLELLLWIFYYPILFPLFHQLVTLPLGWVLIQNLACRPSEHCPKTSLIHFWLAMPFILIILSHFFFFQQYWKIFCQVWWGLLYIIGKKVTFEGKKIMKVKQRR